MVWHMQKRWRLSFRKDPDAGRVLFIGPVVISLDVILGFPKDAAKNAESGSGFQATQGIDAEQHWKRKEIPNDNTN